jgi:hypothetical protein
VLLRMPALPPRRAPDTMIHPFRRTRPSPGLFLLFSQRRTCSRLLRLL